MQAIEYVNRTNIEGNLLARQMCEQAIALDPEYARPHRILGYTHVIDIMLGLSKSPKKSMEQALELAQKAISLDESDPCGHELLSKIYLWKRQHERAIAEAERAITVDPNGADGHARLGDVLRYAGRPEEAIASLKKAIRMNPIAPGYYFLHLGGAYGMTGRYEEAIEAFKKALERSPDNIFVHLSLAEVYSLSGREEEARAAAKEVLRRNPNFSLERFAKTIPYKNRADLERAINALHKAGLE